MGLRRFANPILSMLFVLTLLGPAGALAQGASPTADLEDNKAIVAQVYEAFTAGDLDALDAVVAPDVVDHFPLDPGQAPGWTGLKATFAGLRTAFPDVVCRAEEIAAEGDRVAVLELCSGTQQGDFLGIPPTNRAGTVRSIDVWRVEGGQLTEFWGFIDVLGLLTQLGVVPGAEAAATPPAATPRAIATPDVPATPADAADVEANKAVARRYLEAFDTGDPAILDEVLAPDFVYRSAGPGEPTDREGQKQVVAAFGTAFPDGQSTVEDLIAEGNTVVLRWTFTGTHQGDFFGIPPTGRSVTVRGIDWYHLEGGQITEIWDVIDEVGLLTQLGVLPGPAATPPSGTPAAT